MNSRTKVALPLNFRNLPLVEAAVRASLESPVKLTFRILNDMAARLRNEFPDQSELDQFHVPPGIRVSKIDLSPQQIPGAVFRGNKDGISITAQSQVIIARWMKRAGTDAPEYPRYRALRDSLWRAVNCLREVCEQPPPRIVVVNMSYVNFVQSSQGPAVLRRYFSGRACLAAADKAQKVHKLEAAWQEPDGVDLRLCFEHVTAKVETESIEGYRFTTACGQHVSEGESDRDALDMVHDCLQGFFVDIISDDAKKDWGLEHSDA